MIYKVITKTSQKLNLRESPSLFSDIKGYLLKDKIYTFDRLSEDYKWAHTYYGDKGAEGWASMDYLKTPDLTNNKPALAFTVDELKNIRKYIDDLIMKGGG